MHEVSFCRPRLSFWPCCLRNNAVSKCFLFPIVHTQPHMYRTSHQREFFSFLCSIKGIFQGHFPDDICCISIICVADKRQFCKGTSLIVDVL